MSISCVRVSSSSGISARSSFSMCEVRRSTSSPHSRREIPHYFVESVGARRAGVGDDFVHDIAQDMMFLNQQIAEVRHAIFGEHRENRDLFEIEMAGNLTSDGLAKAIHEPPG